MNANDQLITSFSECNIKSELVEPGVYWLLDGSEIVYVGQSRNVFARIDQHERQPAPWDSWNWERIEGEAQRWAREGELIAQHQPRYNVNGCCGA